MMGLLSMNMYEFNRAIGERLTVGDVLMFGISAVFLYAVFVAMTRNKGDW